MADGLDQLTLTWLRDIVGGFLEGSIEPMAMLTQLCPGTLVLTEQSKECRRVLPFKALLHILGGDYRVIIVGDDTPRDVAHAAQVPGTPPPESHKGGNEEYISEQ